MVRQYPHYLFAVRSSRESQQDEWGYWTDAEPQTLAFLSMCREETDGRGAELRTADGTYHRVTALIQVPKGAKLCLKEGEVVAVCECLCGRGLRIQGRVLKLDNGQLHTRLWV